MAKDNHFGLDLDMGLGLGLDLDLDGITIGGKKKAAPDPDAQFLKGCRLNFSPVTWENAKRAGELVDIDQDMFALVGGQFVFMNFIEGVIWQNKFLVDEIYLTTLGLSEDNLQGICNLVDHLHVGKVNLIVSHYWVEVERRGLVPVMMEMFKDKNIRVAVVANHSKMCLMRTRSHGDVTMFGSANLSSSDNLEVFAITHDQGVFDFSKGALDGILEDFTIYDGATDEARFDRNKGNRGKTILGKVQEYTGMPAQDLD